MAKSKKAGAKKKAAKSAKGAKSPKTAKPKAVAKPKKGKPIETKVEPMSDHEAALVALPEIGVEAFDDPMKMDSATLETATRELIAVRGQNDAKLSAYLYAIEEKRIHVDHGWDRNEYFVKVLNISAQKASEMINNWRMLVTLGVNLIRKVVGLSWEKVKILKAGVAAGVITPRNVEDWLEKCAVRGGKALTQTDLLDEVKKAVGKKAKKELDKTRKKISFDIMAYEQDTLNLFESLAMSVLDTKERGRAYVQAAVEYATAHADDKDAASRKIMSLANIKEFAERVAPVCVLFYPLDPELAERQIGVAPTLHVYQGYGGKEGERELSYCVAVSDKEAKETLGVKEIRKFRLLVGKSLLPKEPFKADKFSEAGVVKAVEDKEMPWLADIDTVRERIRAITRERKMSREEYNAIKAEVKAHLKTSGETLLLDQAVLRRLLS